MVNYAQSVQLLKEFVERNNIRTGEPSGKNGRLLRIDSIVTFLLNYYKLCINFNGYNDWQTVIINVFTV